MMYVRKHDFVYVLHPIRLIIVSNKFVQNLTTGGKKGVDFGFDEKIFGGSLFWHAIETDLQEYICKSYAKF